MNIRKLQSLTKEELIDLIRHEREGHAVDAHEIPPVAHRLIWKLKSGNELPHFWTDGEPKKELLDAIAKGGAARIQYAYPALARPDHCEDILHMVPRGFKLVSVEPTPEMLTATYLPGGIDGYRAMLAAAPQPDHIPDTSKMPTDTEMLDWLIKHSATIDTCTNEVITENGDWWHSTTIRDAIIEAIGDTE